MTKWTLFIFSVALIGCASSPYPILKSDTMKVGRGFLTVMSHEKKLVAGVDTDSGEVTFYAPPENAFLATMDAWLTATKPQNPVVSAPTLPAKVKSVAPVKKSHK